MSLGLEDALSAWGCVSDKVSRMHYKGLTHVPGRLDVVRCSAAGWCAFQFAARDALKVLGSAYAHLQDLLLR